MACYGRCVTLAAFALVVAQGSSLDVAEFLRAHRAADRALDSHRLAEAVAGFERCLALHPKHASAAYGLACARALEGNRDAALEWLSAAVTFGFAEPHLALWDEHLASLRNSDEFQASVSAMRSSSAPAPWPPAASIFDQRAKAWPVDAGIDRAGSRIVAGFSDGTLALFDASNAAELARSPQLSGAVWDVCLSADGATAIALTVEGLAHFCAAHDAKPFAQLRALRAPAPNDDALEWPFGAELELDPSGERVLIAGRDRGALLATVKGEKIASLDVVRGRMFDVVVHWSHDGSRIGYARGNELAFVDGRTGAEMPASLRTPARVDSAAFSPDGRFIATGHGDGKLRVWSASDLSLAHESEPIFTLFPADTSVRRIAFSPDSSKLAFSTTEIAHVRVCQVESWTVLGTSSELGGRMGEPALLCWSSNSQRLWSAFASGAGGPHEFELADAFVEALPRTRTRTPSASGASLAVSVGSSAIVARDSSSGDVLWCRANLGRSGSLFHTPEGYFDASFDELSELVMFTASDKGIELTEVATWLFDPKRVRAARAGVALASIQR